MLAVSVFALVLSGAAFERWEFLGVLAFTGVGVLATVPVQSSLLADAFPIRARPIVFALYVAIGAVGFALGPLIVAATTALFDGTRRVAASRSSWPRRSRPSSRSRPGACRDARRGRAEVEEVFHDDGGISDEHLTTVHALTRFRQIATLRFMTIGVLAMGFAFLGWGLWFNLWLLGHFQLRATDRALLLALVALPALVTTPLAGRLAGAQFRRSPRRTIWLSAALLLGFDLAIVGWWTHTVATTIVLAAAGFACVAAAIATDAPGRASGDPPADARAGVRRVHQHAVHRGVRRGSSARRVLARARAAAHDAVVRRDHH